VKLDGRMVPVHRFLYELRHGPVPDGMFVCHACDTPSCCRPDHLFAALPHANSEDMAAKGRSTWGEHSKRAKLTTAQVTDIRRRYAGGESQRRLAKEFGVAQTTIGFAVRGDTWRRDELLGR